MNIIIAIEIGLIAIFIFPSIIGLKTYIVTSGSMEPLYPTGSLLYVKKVDASEIKQGDAITFYMEDSSIIATHQVYEIDKDNLEFRTQGINNIDEDGKIIHDVMPVKYKSLIGKPVFCIQNLGYINRLITTPPGMYVIIVFTIFIILINLILENFIERKEDYEKSQKNKKNQ